MLSFAFPSCIRLASLAFCLASTGVALAAPQINNLSLRGLQTGSTTTIAIDGADLAANPKLSLPIPIAEQALHPDSTPKQAMLQVTLGASVPAGIYPLRLINDHGISNEVLIGVDALPQQPLAPEAAELPVAFHGAVTGSNSARTRFDGKAGKRVVIDVEARRLGSKLNPVLKLYDSRGLQIAWRQTQRTIQGDARLEIALPADDTYTVELHDAAYQGANPSFFRLKIGDLQFADFTLPLAVERGTKATLQLIGSTGATIAVQAPDAPLAAPVDWTSVAGATGGRPWFYVSDHSEYVENTTDDDVESVPAAPVGISGRLAQPREEDMYQLPVTPGAKLRFEVLAYRLGSGLDPVLTLRDAQGKQLARNDDAAGMIDPQLDYTVPEGTTELQLAISDLTRRGGPGFVYRVVVTQLDAPRLSISLDRDNYAIPQGGSTLLTFNAERAGYAGPIQLDLGPLPSGVSVSTATIPAGADRALVSLSAGAAAPPIHWTTQAIAHSDDPAKLTDVAVLAGPDPPIDTRPWLANRLTLAVTNAAPLQIATEGLDAQPKVQQGAKLSGKLKLVRAAGGEGAVRLSLVTTQIVPKKKIKKDNKEQQIPDLDRALRLDGETTIGADASELAIALLVPGDLPPQTYDLAIKAEQLSADGKQVTSTAFTPVVRLQVEAAPKEAEAAADTPDAKPDAAAK